MEVMQESVRFIREADDEEDTRAVTLQRGQVKHKKRVLCVQDGRQMHPSSPKQILVMDVSGQNQEAGWITSKDAAADVYSPATGCDGGRHMEKWNLRCLKA